MTDAHWKQLLSVIKGEPQAEIPVGFIIDCPWLPNWYGISLVDYFSNDDLWLKANFAAIDAFPLFVCLSALLTTTIPAMPMLPLKWLKN